jgi:uncharacterized lipoprotein YmbA
MRKNPPCGCLSAIVLTVCLALTAGCSSSPPTRFYVLSNLPHTTQPPPSAGQDIAVGVGPLLLPDYLDRPQIVTRTGQNELNLAEFDKWGESVKDNANQVLAENLAVLLPSKKIHTYPWKRSTPVDYQVVVKITRFDHSEGGETALHARWNILNGDGSAELLSRETRYADHPDGTGYAAIVAAMNRAWAQFSRDVANAIRNQANGDVTSP